MEIRQATRQHVKPLIGVYAESGCGKTMSALLLARGMVGPTGKIVMADSESGRGELYADVIPGGYQVLPLEPPFSPARYIEAHNAIVKAGAAIGIIDSVSHAWEGQGGVLDMAAENEAKSGKGLHVWKMPKMEHAKFMLCLLQSPIPWIVCLRAKYKTRMVKDKNGRSEVVKDDKTTPIQADDFIFEMTAHFEILPDHSIVLTKCSHPSLRDCFPSKGPITIEHGQKIAAWCAAPGAAPKVEKQSDPSIAAVKDLRAKLWAALEPVRGTERTWTVAEKWMKEKGIIGEIERVSDMSAGALIAVIEQAQKLAKLEEATA